MKSLTVGMATYIGIPRRYGIEIEVVDVVDVTVDTVAGFLIEKVGAGSYLATNRSLRITLITHLETPMIGSTSGPRNVRLCLVG